MENNRPESTIRRIGGYLHRVVPITDAAGKVLHYATHPLMVEFRARDFMQVVVGASILAVPVALTQEVWDLGVELPLANVLGLSAISLLFIGLFVYLNFYRFMLKDHRFEFIKRVIAIYGLSLVVVGLILTVIHRCPWGTDTLLALKRVMITAFPASMSAAVSDVLK